jgi:hypothetical protein
MSRLTPCLACIVLVLSGAGCHQDAFAGPDSIAMISCPKTLTGGVSFSHGIVLSHFPGRAVDSITLWIGGQINDVVTLSAVFRHDAFDGQILRTDTAGVTLTSAEMPITIRPLTTTMAAGDNYTLVLHGISARAAYISTFTRADCTGVLETRGTAPPLDSTEHVGIPIIVYGRI